MKAVWTGLSVAVFLSAAACSATKGVDPTITVRAPDEPKEQETPRQKLAMVDATILVTDCSKVSNYSASAAEKTMRRLVEDCDSVPGGHVEFVATLVPGGRIEISSVDGTDGTVPICVLRHQLQHQVAITKACKLHVQMEQKSPSPVVDAGA
jgi:hypothetical protein